MKHDPHDAAARGVEKAPVVTGSGNVIGHIVIDGVPFINGQRARHDPPKPKDRKIALLDGAFSEYRCPECDARLSGGDMICLNTCHLSAASAARFRMLMAAAAMDVQRQERIAADLASGKMSVVDAIKEAGDSHLEPLMKSLYERGKRRRAAKETDE